ncbi:GTPase [Serinicoccus chungangensis]|uniref:GTPase n=1 Tax=Serinicoccus chungangensis TaxID=767452 RepID=UPI00137AEBA5|nr:GTPase [Serinicoccus chungangensis]
MNSEATDYSTLEDDPTAIDTPIGDADMTNVQPPQQQSIPTVAEAVAAGLAEPSSEKAMREAVDSAIAGSQQEVRYLKAQIRKGKASLRSASKRARDALREVDHGGAASLKEASVAITDLLQGASEEIDNYFSRYEDVLKTFNIALFGRTGAGKSSLISALAELDGERVSRGESDWTVDVTPIEWNSCRLYDTPGINGWGRTRSVGELEMVARRAVEVADVVLLCFDTQSQQASEFSKVAAWVQEFSKPAIAVLNVRNAMWRHPARMTAKAGRSNLQKAVQEHGSNITDFLASIGMHSVPVVAIQTKRALAAKAKDPYRGPDEVNHSSARQEFGIDYLYTWSNLGTLQDLISALVKSGGKELRVNGLREGVRSIIQAWHEALGVEAENIQGRLSILDAAIAEEFDLLGYPDAVGGSPWLAVEKLSAVEDARGGPYKSRKVGRFERHTSQVIRNELGVLKTKSLKEASNAVRDTFDKKIKLNQEQFTQRVFDDESIRTAAKKAADRSSVYLAQELKMVATEAAADIEFEQRLFNVDGKAGKVGDRIGIAARLLAVAGGAVSAGMAIAIAANLWNPIGWVGAAAVVVTGIVSSVLGGFGKKYQTSAEKKRLRARKEALGNARLSVTKAYTQVEESLAQSFLREARKSRAPAVHIMLGDYLAISTAQVAVVEAAEEIWQRAEGMERADTAASVMRKALKYIKTENGGSMSANAILLGEDWIKAGSDYAGLPVAPSDELHALADLDTKQLVRAVTTAAGLVTREELTRWLEGLTELAERSPEVKHIQHSACQMLDEPARVVLFGDYNTGKSSLIKRLLAELGTPTPKSLGVAGKPTTAEETSYRWRNLQLVDSPGLQSCNAEHDSTARGSVSGASIAIVVLNVNLVIGDDAALKAFLVGTDATRAKQENTIFVIGRADELGVDPLGSPAQFLRLRRQKESELRALLARWGVGDITIHMVSADPYGAVGDLRASGPKSYEDLHRQWDGIAPLIAALERANEEQALLSQVGALDFAVDGLLAAKQALLADYNDLDSSRLEESKILTAIERGIRSGKVLRSSLTAEGKAMARSHAERAASEAMSATQEHLEAAAKAAAKWWVDPEFQADAVVFYDDAQKKISAWSEETASDVSRSVRWSNRHSTGKAPSALRQANRFRQGVNYGRGANHAAKALANIFKERDALYGAVKKFTDIKFKPWGATKAAAKVAKVGAVLAVVGVVLDLGAFVSDQVAASKREEARKRLAHAIDETVGQVEKMLLDGDRTNEGPAKVLDEALSRLARMSDASAARQREIEALMHEKQELVEAIEELVYESPHANGKVGTDV